MVNRPAEAVLDGLYRMSEAFLDTFRPGNNTLLDITHLGDNVILEIGYPLADMSNSPPNARPKDRGKAVSAIYPSEERLAEG